MEGFSHFILLFIRINFDSKLKLLMFRDLGLQRGSNSVCGRFIQNEKLSSNDFDITDDDMCSFDCDCKNGSPKKRDTGHLISNS